MAADLNPEDFKRCPKCGDAKELSLFKVRKAAPSGRSSWCKACDSAQGRARYAADGKVRVATWARSLERLYNMTLKDYERLFESQGGVCATCGSPPKNDRRLSVDHDHATGAVRGLLCGFCNHIVGILELPNGLDSYRAYLDRHEGADALVQAGW